MKPLPFLALLASCPLAMVQSASTVATGDDFVSRSQIEDLLRGSSLGAAESAALRPLPPIALAMIKDFEAWVPSAYDDASMYCTIGYGHLIALRPCAKVNLVTAGFPGSLSKTNGETLLQTDTGTARDAIKVLVKTDVTNEQFGALASFAFNVGKDNFTNSTLLKLVNLRAFEAATKEFPRWVLSKGRLLHGLVDRRACEAMLFNGALQFSGDGKFSRVQCTSYGIATDIGTPIDIDRGETSRSH